MDERVRVVAIVAVIVVVVVFISNRFYHSECPAHPSYFRKLVKTKGKTQQNDCLVFYFKIIVILEDYGTKDTPSHTPDSA